MPSPLGHALAGAAVGWALADDRARRHFWRWGAVSAILAMLPDVDLLFGAHSGPTHGLGAALIAALAVAAIARRPRLAVAAGCAYASHTLLDWLATDTSPPIGIMALWPFSHDYYESTLHLFAAISRRYWIAGFWSHNLRAVAWEVLILAPPLAIVLWLRRGRSVP